MTPHGDFMTPFQRYICSTEYGNFVGFTMHWHEEIEIGIVRKGTISYYIDFEHSTFHEGDLILISPHALHSASPEGVAETDSFVVNLDFLGCHLRDVCAVKYLMPLLNGVYRMKPRVTSEDPEYSQLLSYLRKIFAEQEAKNYGYELAIKESLLSFLRCLFQNSCMVRRQKELVQNQTEEKVKLVLNYINRNHTEQLTIRELADLCGFSESHFMRFFKKHTGVTVIEYINEFRLDMAAELLEMKESAVIEAAFETGFNNVSYFNRLFKQKFGLTPREYRKMRLRCLTAAVLDQ